MLIGGFGQDPTLFKHGRDHVEEYIYVHTYTCIHLRSKSSKDSRRYENPVADVTDVEFEYVGKDGRKNVRDEGRTVVDAIALRL